MPIIDRVRLPCFHATFFFSPLQTHRSHKKECTWNLLTIGSTSAVLMADTSDLAQLLMDGHRIEDFQHNLFQKITLTILATLVGCKAMGSHANFLLPFPASRSKVTSKPDMSLQVTCPIFALGTLVCSLDRIFRGEFRTSNLS
ncbi:hypothetical protein Peur_026623 [Populus x canadensis]